MTVQRAEFTIFYDGPALQGSQMDVRALAPALLALGEVLEAANGVLNKDKASVRVNVKAFQPGCFGVSFEMVQDLYNVVCNMLKPGSELRNTLEILNLLGLNLVNVGAATGVSVFGLIKKLKGKNPKSTTRLENGNVSIEFDSEEGIPERVEVSPEVAALYADKPVRVAIDKTMEPLRREGIDSFSVKEGENLVPLVTKAEAPSFSLGAAQQTEIPVNESEETRVLSIVSLSFKEDNKWRLSDGDATFNVKISDAFFLATIAEGRVVFGKGDSLKLKLVTKAMSTSDGLKTDYEAVEILEVIPATRQLFLPVENDPGGDTPKKMPFI